ncbi:hypothetical protein SASPL_118018 [Salvia splendens]|uniref:Uncharacterized protein n=1 Tax=Salvia splendens TaxID=180675 RepID=A0A8X8XWX3_SALSN|nr:hypothetical protein SASPL_118018 [Salvia splendens]
MVDTRKSSTNSGRQLRSGRTSGEVKADLKYYRKKTAVIGSKIDEEEVKATLKYYRKKTSVIGRKIDEEEEMINLKQKSGGDFGNDERRTKYKHDKQQHTVNKAKGLSISILDAALEEMMTLNQTTGGNDESQAKKRMRETECSLPSGVQGNDARKEQGKAKKVARNNAKGDASRPSAQRVLCLKRGPRKFVEAIESLNVDQRDAVENMGFGSLLHFKLNYIPAKLAFEILDHFDQDTCGVVYQRGILHIGHDDVRATLGLPNGSVRLEDNGHQRKNKFINELAESVGRKRSNMGAQILTDMMLSDICGGEKFRKIFLILVDTILINPSGDGYLHTQIEDVIHDIDNVREYNWCGYVIDCLLDAHKTWARNKDKPFTGPISFLVPCYVDRIVLRSRPVTRTFPTIKGWTSTLIHEREKLELESGPFGRGIEEPIFDPKRNYKSKESAKENTVSSSRAKTKDISLTAQRRSTVVNLMGKAADVLGELMKELEDGAEDLKNDGCSKVAAKCSMKMMGLHEMEPEEEANDVQSMSQAMEQDDLDNPEFIAAVEKVMRVVEQRKKWQTEGPSFDLGFEFHERNVDTTPTRDIDPGNYIFDAVQFMPVQDLDKDIPPSITNVNAGLMGNLEVNLVAEDFNPSCVFQNGANMRSHTDNEPNNEGAKDIPPSIINVDAGIMGNLEVNLVAEENNIPMEDVTQSSNFSVDAVLRGNLEVNFVAEDFNTSCVVQHGTNVTWHTDNRTKDDGVKNANVVAEIQSVIDAYKEIDMDDDDFMDNGPVCKPVGTEVIIYNANKLYTIVTKPQSMDANTVIANFCNNLDRELKEIPYFKWEDVNMVQASLVLLQV